MLPADGRNSAGFQLNTDKPRNEDIQPGDEPETSNRRAKPAIKSSPRQEVTNKNYRFPPSSRAAESWTHSAFLTLLSRPHKSSDWPESCAGEWH